MATDRNGAAIAILSGQPEPEGFIHATVFRFGCEICKVEYQLFVPKIFSFEQAGKCREIGQETRTEQHPDHLPQMELNPFFLVSDTYNPIFIEPSVKVQN
jgi:hypothetical protein